MITLHNSLSFLNLEPYLSLHTALHSLFQAPHRRSTEQIKYDYEKQLSIQEPIGNAVLDASELLYYPALCSLLRKIRPYPIYTLRLNLSELSSLESDGIDGILEGLAQLQQALSEHRAKKASLDAQVNNLIFLHGQQKARPCYEGSKRYDPAKNGEYDARSIYIIRISGISYFNQLPTQKHRLKKTLYELSADNLLKAYYKSNLKGETAYDNIGFSCISRFIGGIVNTPILVFRCAKNYRYKGKRYYLDLHTQRLMNKLSEARDLAYQYAGDNYYFDIFGEKEPNETTHF